MTTSTLPVLVNLAPYSNFVTKKINEMSRLSLNDQARFINRSRRWDDEYYRPTDWWDLLDEEGEPKDAEAMDDFRRLDEAVRLRDREVDDVKVEILDYTVASLYAYFEARRLATENALRDYAMKILDLIDEVRWKLDAIANPMQEVDREGNAEQRWFDTYAQWKESRYDD